MITKSFPTQDPAGISITDTRRVVAGLITRNADRTPRPGILPVSAAPLVTGRSNMAYDVAPFHAVTSRLNTGVELVANDASMQIATDAAPGSNSRIDVIYLRSQFLQHADGSNLAIIGVAKGVAAAIPTKPAIPDGALELATAVIPSSATTTLSSGVVITQTHQYTALAGAAVPFRNVTEMLAWTTTATHQRARLLSTGTDFVWDGTRWYGEDGTLLPTTVVGGTVDDAGLIVPNTGAGTLRVDGIFSSRYRVYECEWAFNLSATAGTTLRLAKSGTAHTGSGYGSQRLSGNSSTAAAVAQNTNSWPAVGVAAPFVQGTWKFVNPFHSGPKFLNVDANSAPTLGLAIDRGFLSNQDATQFDGFEFAIGGQTIANGGLSFLRVRGVA